MESKNSLEELKSWGDLAMKSGIVPQGTNQFQAMAIVQAGKEIGLQPLQSLRCMAFIRGRLTMTVQLQLALAKSKGVKLAKVDEVNHSCTVTLTKDSESITCSYTLDDAKKAGLVQEKGAYEKYERQMLRWRAIGDALKLIAPDLVMGIYSPEEIETIEEPKPSIQARTEAKTEKLKAQLQPTKPEPEKPAEEPETKETNTPSTETCTPDEPTDEELDAEMEMGIPPQKDVTGIAKITQSKARGVYRIEGEAKKTYVTSQEDFATLAKSAQQGGLKCNIAYQQCAGENVIIGIDITEPEKEVKANA